MSDNKNLGGPFERFPIRPLLVLVCGGGGEGETNQFKVDSIITINRIYRIHGIISSGIDLYLV
jgi:hypothetical protein